MRWRDTAGHGDGVACCRSTSTALRQRRKCLELKRSCAANRGSARFVSSSSRPAGATSLSARDLVEATVYSVLSTVQDFVAEDLTQPWPGGGTLPEPTVSWVGDELHAGYGGGDAPSSVSRPCDWRCETRGVEVPICDAGSATPPSGRTTTTAIRIPMCSPTSRGRESCGRTPGGRSPRPSSR